MSGETSNSEKGQSPKKDVPPLTRVLARRPLQPRPAPIGAHPVHGPRMRFLPSRVGRHSGLVCSLLRNQQISFTLKFGAALWRESLDEA